MRNSKPQTNILNTFVGPLFFIFTGPLNCSHVYGYTTLLERMYPELGKDMAYSSFVRNYIAGTGVRDSFPLA